MKKLILISVLLLLSISLSGCVVYDVLVYQYHQLNGEATVQPPENQDKEIFLHDETHLKICDLEASGFPYQVDYQKTMLDWCISDSLIDLDDYYENANYTYIIEEVRFVVDKSTIELYGLFFPSNQEIGELNCVFLNDVFDEYLYTESLINSAFEDKLRELCDEYAVSKTMVILDGENIVGALYYSDDTFLTEEWLKSFADEYLTEASISYRNPLE